MNRNVQKWLAVSGALLGVTIFIGANAHLLRAAFQSQPECVVVDHDAAIPARRAC